jgi:hypothetical protein
VKALGTTVDYLLGFDMLGKEDKDDETPALVGAVMNTAL